MWPEWLMLGVIAVFLAGTLFTAFAYPPTLNYDSLTYHMPRVFFWMKNGSVFNYPTTIARQLYVGPFAEYGILQLQVLNFGSDAAANLVQWLAYAGQVLTVGGIAAQLGGNSRSAVMAALLAATTPLAVMQARNTQTDLVVSFWCAVAVWYVLWFIRQRPAGREALEWAALTGLGCGAATLTKNTAFAILAPFALLLLIKVWKTTPKKQLAAMVGLAAAGVLVFNLGFMARNAIDLDGNLLAFGLPETEQFLLATYSPRYRLAALVINLFANFGSQSLFLSHFIDGIVHGIIAALGISQGDPVVFTGEQHFTSFVAYQGHDYAGNPLQFGLILIAAVAVVALFSLQRRKKAEPQAPLGYLLCCAAALCLVGLTIKWTEDASTRYGLPALLLALGFVPLPFEKGSFGRSFLAGALLLITLNATKPLLFDLRQPLAYSPRLAADMSTQQAVGWWSHSRQDLRLGQLGLDDIESFKQMLDELKASGAKRIGIAESGGRAIYPCLDRLAGAEYDVRYINAAFHTKKEAPDFVPEAVIKLYRFAEDPIAAGEVVDYHGQSYRAAAFSRSGSFCYTLFLPE